jgi:hypothetical protein
MYDDPIIDGDSGPTERTTAVRRRQFLGQHAAAGEEQGIDDQNAFAVEQAGARAGRKSEALNKRPSQFGIEPTILSIRQHDHAFAKRPGDQRSLAREASEFDIEQITLITIEIEKPTNNNGERQHIDGKNSRGE